MYNLMIYKKKGMKQYLVTTALFAFTSSTIDAQIESFKQGKIMYEEYRYQEAEPILKNVSEQGISEAYLYLGKIYEDDFYMYSNSSKAANFMLRFYAPALSSVPRGFHTPSADQNIPVSHPLSQQSCRSASSASHRSDKQSGPGLCS